MPPKQSNRQATLDLCVNPEVPALEDQQLATCAAEVCTCQAIRNRLDLSKVAPNPVVPGTNYELDSCDFFGDSFQARAAQAKLHSVMIFSGVSVGQAHAPDTSKLPSE